MKIGLVEDCNVMRELIRQLLLSKSSDSPVSIHGLYENIELIPEDDFTEVDVWVCDLHLGTLDCEHVLDWARFRGENSHVILISSDQEKIDQCVWESNPKIFAISKIDGFVEQLAALIKFISIQKLHASTH